MKKQKTDIKLINSLALLALAISIASIYFSVFYKKYNLTVSLIDSQVKYSGNVINLKLLYHNQGNIYSTIIQEYLTFYQTDDWENEGVLFKEGVHVYQFDYAPVVLEPGEQFLRNLETVTNFNAIDTIQRNLNLEKKINIGLVSTYINKSGLRTSDMFPVGYVLLNENLKITKYKLNYNVFELSGNHYYSSTEIE